MDSKAENQEFEKTIAGDDFDFDFDEDFESEVRSEYVVMDAMRFDRETGQQAVTSKSTKMKTMPSESRVQGGVGQQTQKTQQGMPKKERRAVPRGQARLHCH